MGWVDLPQEIFGTGVPGVVIVHPQSSSNVSYNITTCTLNAGWGSSSIFTMELNSNDVDSYMTQVPPSFPPPRTFRASAYEYVFTNTPMFSHISNSSYPQLHINISKSWMEFINPTVITWDNSTTSIFFLHDNVTTGSST